MKLVEKSRVGSKLKRRYDKPHTPLERLLNCPGADRTKTEELKRLRNQTDPFELAKRIEQKLECIYQMANHRISPSPQTKDPTNIQTLTRSEKQTISEISKIFAKGLIDGFTKYRPKPHRGGCPSKGRCQIVNPGANTEEVFHNKQIFKKRVM